MARRARLADDVVLWRADSLRQAKQYRGTPLHFGRGRPPKGHMGFMEALAQRTGYSTTIVQRILAKRSRSGPARPAPQEGVDQRRLLARLPRQVLEQTLQAVWNVALERLHHLGHDASVDPLTDERLDPAARLERVIEILAQAPSTPPATLSSTQRAEATLWRTTPPVSVTSRQPVIDQRLAIREALAEALVAALMTEGALPDQVRPLAEQLDRGLGS